MALLPPASHLSSQKFFNYQNKDSCQCVGCFYYSKNLNLTAPRVGHSCLRSSALGQPVRDQQPMDIAALGQPVRATFPIVLPQRATSYTWPHMNITPSLLHSNTYLCSATFIVNITHQRDKDRNVQAICYYACYLVGLLVIT